MSSSDAYIKTLWECVSQRKKPVHVLTLTDIIPKKSVNSKEKPVNDPVYFLTKWLVQNTLSDLAQAAGIDPASVSYTHLERSDTKYFYATVFVILIIFGWQIKLSKIYLFATPKEFTGIVQYYNVRNEVIKNNLSNLPGDTYKTHDCLCLLYTSKVPHYIFCITTLLLASAGFWQSNTLFCT